MQVALDHVEDIAQGIKTFWFKPHRPLRYEAGQFIELRLPHSNPDKRGEKRWFTLSSSPTEELLSITTKLAKENGSTFKQTLQNLAVGDEVQMSEAMGDFVLPKDTSLPLVFVAGGIGVTPVRSMVKFLIDTDQTRAVHVIYAANSLEEVAFKDIFSRVKLDIVLANPPSNWQGLTGRLDAGRILDMVEDRDNSLIYLSGPEPMVEVFWHDMKAKGIAKQHLVTDFFPGYEA